MTRNQRDEASTTTRQIEAAASRSVLCLLASALAAIAAVLSSLDGDLDLVPFFVGLTFAAGLLAWAVHPPMMGARRTFARLAAIAWVSAAIWIGGLLVMYQATCGCSRAAPTSPVQTYLGLPATAYHLAATYLGGALVVVAVFGLRGGRASDETGEAP